MVSIRPRKSNASFGIQLMSKSIPFGIIKSAFFFPFRATRLLKRERERERCARRATNCVVARRRQHPESSLFFLRVEEDVVGGGRRRRRRRGRRHNKGTTLLVRGENVPTMMMCFSLHWDDVHTTTLTTRFVDRRDTEGTQGATRRRRRRRTKRCSIPETWHRRRGKA